MYRLPDLIESFVISCHIIGVWNDFLNIDDSHRIYLFLVWTKQYITHKDKNSYAL